MNTNRYVEMCALSVISLVAIVTTTPSHAELPTSRPAPTTAPPQLVTANVFAPRIALPCSGATASDVSARRHSIKNVTGYDIPAGTAVHWVASDKGHGGVVLAKTLPRNDSLDVNEPGHTNGYTCTAEFDPGRPDYAIKSIQWTGPSSATIEAINVNPWVDGSSTVVRVQSFSCLSTTPLAATDVAVAPLAKSGHIFVYASGLPKAKADFLVATANATSSAPESNRSNNDLRSAEYQNCLPK